MDKKENRLEKTIPHLLIIALLSVLVYANSLNGAFVYDDEEFIVNNPYIRSFSPITNFFTSAKAFSAKGNFIVYRPLATLSFALDYALWKLNPSPYHILNILFHMLCGIMVYAVLEMLFKDSLIALFSALLFVVHPVQTEAVTWISARANGMSLFFFLLAFYFFARKKNIVSLLIYALSLLSKESAVVFPLVLIMYDAYASPEADRPTAGAERWKTYVPFILLAVFYILVRHLVLGRTSQTTFWGGGIIPTMLTMSKVLFFYYIRYAFLPVSLCVEHNIPVSFSPASGAVLISILAIIALVFLIVRLYRDSKIISFSILWFLVALIPVSNIIPIQALFAERFLYMPSIGACLLVSFLACGWNRRLAPVFLCIVIVFFSVITIRRNSEWRNGETLWSATLKQNPGSYRAYNDLGVAYERAGRYAEALESYTRAASVSSLSFLTQCNMGVAYDKLGRYEEAMEIYKKAAVINPDSSIVYTGLGVTYGKLGQYDKEMECYKKAVSLKPDDADAYYNMGVFSEKLNRYGDAIEYYRKAVELDPAYAQAYCNLGVVFGKLGRYEEAIESFRKATAVNRDDAKAYYNMSFAYAQLARYDKAIESMKQVVRISRDDVEAHYGLGLFYITLGDEREALKQQKILEKLDRGFAERLSDSIKANK